MKVGSSFAIATTTTAATPRLLDDVRARRIDVIVVYKVAGSVARAPALEIERRVTEAVRVVSFVSNRQGSHALHQPKASGRGASPDSPAVRSSAFDATLRAAIDRVVMSRTTIKIELAEGMTSDDQNRI